MKNKTFTIVGATGNIGQKLVPLLLQRGHQVRAIGRDQAKLESLAKLGAQTLSLDFEDVDALAGAFRGSDAVFTLIPPSYGADDFAAYQDAVSEALVAALRKSGTTQVVNLSSIGAHHDAPTGPIRGLYRHEQRLNALSGLNVLHLRPAYFMENFFWSIPLIQHLGFNTGSLRSETKIPMIATTDIAKSAADHLENSDFQGKVVFELGGPTEVSLQEATTILGKAIARPDLKYVAVDYSAQRDAMVQSGMKPSISGLMVEMNQAIDEGLTQPTQKLARGKTTLETFAKGFAQAFQK